MNHKNLYDQLIEKRKSQIIEDGYFEKHHAIPRALGGTDEKENIVRLTAREHFIAHRLLAKIHGGSMWAALAYMTRGKVKSAKGVRVTGRTYQTIKEKDSEWRSKAYSGEGNYWYGKKIPLDMCEKMRGPRPNIQGEKHPKYGKKITEETALIISEVKKYKYHNTQVFNYTLRDRIDSILRINNKVNSLSLYYRGLALNNKKRDKTGKNNPNYGNGQSIAGEKNPMFGKSHKKETLRKIREKALKREKIKCPFCEVVGIKPNMKRWHFDNCKRKVA